MPCYLQIPEIKRFLSIINLKGIKIDKNEIEMELLKKNTDLELHEMKKSIVVGLVYDVCLILISEKHNIIFDKSTSIPNQPKKINNLLLI